MAGASRPAVAQSPLVVPLAKPVPETEGWLTRGSPRVSAVADMGGGGWLAAWSYGPAPEVAAGKNEGRVVARIINARNGNEVQPPSEGSLPLLTLSHERALDNMLRVLRGVGGAWVVWKSTLGIQAAWINGVSGRPAGPAIQLTDGRQNIQVLRAASDGRTVWVGWIEPSAPTAVSGVTLTANGGLPRILGHFAVPAPIPPASVEFAARAGNLLLITGSPHHGAWASAAARVIDASGQVTSGPYVVTGPFSNGLDGLASLTGAISFGNGWMVLWTQTIDAVVPAQVLYGQPLTADGSTAAGTGLRSLFVVPAGSGPQRSVASIDGVAALFYTGGSDPLHGSYAVLLREGEVLRRVPMQAGLLAATPSGAFDGSTPALLTASLTSNRFFTQHLSAYDSRSFEQHASVISQGANTQKEPMMAWVPGACLAGWQEKNDTQSPPVIVVRPYRSTDADQASDVTLPVLGPGFYSSPSMAANGNRVLVVARKDLGTMEGDGPVDDPDDVVGLLMENGRVLGAPIPIATGPGSQRAARVVACGEGFCVVWREELPVGPSERRSRIRCSFLSRDGVATAPDGLTLVSEDTNEVSAPAVASRGDVVAIVWRTLPLGGVSRVQGTIRAFGSAADSPILEIFNESTRARNPDIIADPQGFSVAARVYADPKNEYIGLVSLSTEGLVSPPTAISQGREPAFASLGAGEIALCWLNDVDDADSTEIWMARRSANGRFNEPTVVRRGQFDRDTLAARGDGNGRVLLAVESRAFADEGIQFFLLAPGVTSLPEIRALTPTPTPPIPPQGGLSFRWRPNVLFPATRGAIESSHDLHTWAPVPEAAGHVTPLVENGVPEALFNTLPPSPEGEPARPFYRLRAVVAD